MDYVATLSFIVQLLCYLVIASAHGYGDRPFYGRFNEERSINDDAYPRAIAGGGPKFEFFGNCSPWHPFGRWWLPNFLRNVSTGGMSRFCDIVRKENSTKAEIEKQLDQWANDQGADIYMKFKNHTDQRQQMRDDVKQKIQELIANVSQLIDDEEKILSDTSLTKREEKEQLTNLRKEASWPVMKLAHIIRKEASFLAAGHRRGPCCGPMFLSMPRPFQHHVFGFGPGIAPGRGPNSPRDGGEAFRQNGQIEHNGPFEKDSRFAREAFRGRNRPPLNNGF